MGFTDLINIMNSPKYLDRCPIGCDPELNDTDLKIHTPLLYNVLDFARVFLYTKTLAGFHQSNDLLGCP